jgi:aminoglycoside 3-N-acetyltransferase
MIIKEHIFDLLEKAGIKSTDTVLIHTSMRALGEVEGGCDGVIDAFCEYLKDGLFIVPTHTWANVNVQNPVYDVRHTKPCIGALPTVAAFRSDGVRSLHPTHSISAFGKDAESFVAGEEKCTSPCPPHGAWARLYEKDAKILLLGVGLNRNTYIHAIDEMLCLQGRLSAPDTLYVIDQKGNKLKTSFSHHTELTGSENFGNFQKPLEKLGAIEYFTLGDAKVTMFNVKKGTAVIKHLWSKADYHLCAEVKDIPENYYSDFFI